MAYYAVLSPGGGSADGSDFSNAYASIAAAIAGGLSDGDCLLCDDTHSKDYGAAQTLTFANSIRVISVDKDVGSFPNHPYSSGATEGVWSAIGLFKVDISAASKIVTFEGLTFDTQTSNTNTTAPSFDISNDLSQLVFRDCSFYKYPGGPFKLSDSAKGGHYIITECLFDKNDSSWGGYIFQVNHGDITIQFASCSFADVQANHFISYQDVKHVSRLFVEDCDLSACINDELLGLSAAFNGDAVFRRCRLPSGGVGMIETACPFSSSVTAEYCDDAAITATPLPLYMHEVYGGTCASTDNDIYLSGSDGENDYSYELVAGTNCSELTPVDCPHKFAIRHDASGAKTLTVKLASDDTGLLTNEVWIRVSYGDDAATTYTTGEFIDTRAKYGYEVGVEASGTFTTNYASDANQLNQTAHGYSDGTPLRLTTTGTIPAGLSTTTTYYVVNSATNTYELATEPGGTPVTLTSDGSGTHTANPVFQAGTIGNWTGSGPNTAYEFVLTGIAPQEPCNVLVQVFFAGPSTYKLWACPKITLT